MKKIIDHIADWLVALNEKKAKANDDYATFAKRGNNGFIIGIILYGPFFLYMAYDLYRDYGKLWLASIPILAFAITIFGVLISDAYKDKLRNRQRKYFHETGRIQYGFQRAYPSKDIQLIDAI